MEERTRYGDLTRQAALHLTAGAVMLTGEVFHGLPAASVALTAYADLYDALYRLGWQLRGGTVAHALVPDPASRDQQDAATLDLLEQVGRVATRSHARRLPRTGVAGQWRRAAVQLRAANDLLATHHTPMGQPRTPATPDLADPATVGPAWQEYAALVLAAATVAEPLAARGRAAGVTPARVGGLPWAGERLTRAAEHLRATARRSPPGSVPVGGATSIIDIEVANPTIRTGDPLQELGDRIQQIQTAAWLHTERATMTIPTLTDLAAVGVMLHAAAHRALTAEPVADPATVDLISAHGSAWRHVHARLAELRSIDPVPGGIRHNAHAISRLLPDVANDHRRGHAAGILIDACRSHDRVAEWSATAITELSAAGQIYTPGRGLTGDDIGDDPHLATTKLIDRPAPAPPRVVREVLVTLAAASRSPADATMPQAANRVAQDIPICV